MEGEEEKVYVKFNLSSKIYYFINQSYTFLAKKADRQRSKESSKLVFTKKQKKTYKPIHFKLNISVLTGINENDIPEKIDVNKKTSRDSSIASKFLYILPSL